MPNLIAPLKVNEEPGEDRNTKWKRLFNAVATAQNRQGDGRPLIRLIAEIMQPVRFSSTAEFEGHRTAVNERLILSGLQVRHDGKVARVEAARTLAEAQERANAMKSELARRGVHPDVLHFCLAELMQENYFHAVLEACKSVAEKLRQLSSVGSTVTERSWSTRHAQESRCRSWRSTRSRRTGNARSRPASPRS